MNNSGKVLQVTMLCLKAHAPHTRQWSTSRQRKEKLATMHILEHCFTFASKKANVLNSASLVLKDDCTDEKIQ